MSSIRSFSAVLAAILVLPGLVAGGAFATCLHVDPAPHQCGAVGVRCGDAGGLHAANGVSETSAQASHDCSCSHVPNLPADPATTVSTVRAPETPMPLALALPVQPLSQPVQWTVMKAGDHGPPAGTPPVFLLDCALLI